MEGDEMAKQVAGLGGVRRDIEVSGGGEVVSRGRKQAWHSSRVKHWQVGRGVKPNSWSGGPHITWQGNQWNNAFINVAECSNLSRTHWHL